MIKKIVLGRTLRSQFLGSLKMKIVLNKDSLYI